MGWACRFVMACVAMFALAACATVSTRPMKSQNKKSGLHLARLYFIRSRADMLKNATLDIKVDGQLVGKLAPDSYLFIDRPPGSYTLSVEPPADFVYFETNVRVAAGGTYYYAINSASTEVPICSTGGFVTLSPNRNLDTPLAPKSFGASRIASSVPSTPRPSRRKRLDAAQ
ncbi:MAG TPA: DUF2846 domain-containing protein [Xanthobacteraceae bacterium]